MRIMFDANVVLDLLTDREPFTSDAAEIYGICVENGYVCSVAAHTFPAMFYVLRKTHSRQVRLAVLLKTATMFDVVKTDAQAIQSAIGNEAFADFEDSLQHECALAFSADYILTRNKRDFAGSRVSVVDPPELALLISKLALEP